MSFRSRLVQGDIFFAPAQLPEISKDESLGFGKSVQVMSWLTMSDFAQCPKQSAPAEAEDKSKYGVFLAISIHERHLIALPLIKVPCSLADLFPKTCLMANRASNTYLPVLPTMNTVRTPSAQYMLDPLFAPVDVPELPALRKPSKDNATGKKNDLPSDMDSYIDIACPIMLREDVIDWKTEMYSISKSSVKQVVKLYRYVNGLDDGLSPEDIEKEPEERSTPRPTQMLGPDASLTVNNEPIIVSERSSKKDVKNNSMLQNGNSNIGRSMTNNAYDNQKQRGDISSRGRRAPRRGNRGGGVAPPWAGQNFNASLARVAAEAKAPTASTPGKQATNPDTDGTFDVQRREEILHEPWPLEWNKAERSDSPVVKGLGSLAGGGWDDTPVNEVPAVQQVQDWLGMAGEERIYKNWELPEAILLEEAPPIEELKVE